MSLKADLAKDTKDVENKPSIGMKKSNSIVEALKRKHGKTQHLAMGGMVEQDGEMQEHVDGDFLSSVMAAPLVEEQAEEPIETRDSLRKRLMSQAFSRIKNG